ncbi:MAG: PKD domain-containing protein [Thermoplasmatota archaeon]
MAKKKTFTIIGVVAAVGLLLIVGWVTFGSDLVDSLMKDRDGGGNTNNTVEDSNEPPVAILEVDRTFIREGETVIFDGNSSFDKDYNGTLSNNGIFLFEWDFGDGSEIVTSQNGTEKSYQYNDRGEYNVVLTVYDEAGASDSDNVTITVVPQDNPISTGSQILIGQALVPEVGVVPNSTEVNWTVEEGAKVMNLTVTVSGYYFQEMKASEVEVVLFDPYENVMANETLEVTGQGSVRWGFDEEDLTIDGEYYVYIQCFEGAVLVNVEGLVSYVEE